MHTLLYVLCNQKATILQHMHTYTQHMGQVCQCLCVCVQVGEFLCPIILSVSSLNESTSSARN